MWPGLKRFGHAIWSVLRTTAEEYGKDRCSLIAAALAFYAFLSIFPLLIVIVAIFTLLGPWSERMLDLLSEQIVQFAPGMERQVTLQLQIVINRSVSVGSIAFVLLLWSASRGFSTLQTALYAIWNLEGRGPLLHLLFNRLRALALVLLAIIFLIMSLAITSAIEAWKHSSGFSLRLGPLPAFWETLLWVASFLSTVVMFLTVYAIVPAPKIRFRDVVLAAGVSAAWWEIAKRAFAIYVTRAAPGDAVYGTLGTAFLILLWAYWSGAVLLFGAELAWALSHHAPDEPSVKSE